ncbi:MAG: hypothetical protein Q9164_006861, partial [Protoblastenia rupestris]
YEARSRKNNCRRRLNDLLEESDHGLSERAIGQLKQYYKPSCIPGGITSKPEWMEISAQNAHKRFVEAEETLLKKQREALEDWVAEGMVRMGAYGVSVAKAREAQIEGAQGDGKGRPSKDDVEPEAEDVNMDEASDEGGVILLPLRPKCEQ